MKQILINIYYDAVADLQAAITESANGIVSILTTGAAAVSMISTALSGFILLILGITTMWKIRQGNTDAWGDAMQQLATVGAVMCFSISIMAIFF